MCVSEKMIFLIINSVGIEKKSRIGQHWYKPFAYVIITYFRTYLLIYDN
jgi:hypothetical protein